MTRVQKMERLIQRQAELKEQHKDDKEAYLSALQVVIDKMEAGEDF